MTIFIIETIINYSDEYNLDDLKNSAIKYNVVTKLHEFLDDLDDYFNY
ncbi:MAG: hypothetical protein ACRC5M_06190 [Anaeroplasmataceae bacterium]